MARYFVHLPPDGSPAIFWRDAERFAGEWFQYNLNLLAQAVGDNPAALLPAGGTLATPQTYNFGSGTVRLQPFAFTRPGGDARRPEALPLGPNLRRFLNDPLDGEKMDLSLPFFDEEIKLGPSGGGWFRKDNGDSAFHGGSDFDKSPRAVFDVCAAAKGKIQAIAGANGAHGGPIVISHHTPGGKEFRTVYQHLEVTSIPSSLKVGTEVRRGQFLGQVSDVAVIHLHFGVAVQGRQLTLNGITVPPLWYFIDPWGVYDYYEQDGRSNRNYLPPESQPAIFQAMIAGVAHTPQLRTLPLFKTIPIARNTEGYKVIVRTQVRARRDDNLGGTLPDEHEQFLVWLKDDPDFFLVPLAEATDRTSELELVTLLREAFFHDRPVRLEYRYVGELRYIMAAWCGS